MADEPLEIGEAAALAREHGGIVCFISNTGAETTQMGVLSLWRYDQQILILRVQTPDDRHNLVVRLRENDLYWLVDEEPQPMRD